MKKENSIETKMNKMVQKYKDNLEKKINERTKEMKEDDNSHYMVYNILGVSNEEGEKIDLYQNKGRFLYKYAGSMLEDAAILCFKHKYSSAESKKKIKNTISSKPKKVEIDCLVGDTAYEIKWRDATTDGDHITKEHTRVKVIQEKGYKPVRIMFFEPNREQAKDIQKRLKNLYEEVGGEYYSGEEAWEYIKNSTDIDLKSMLNEIINKKSKIKEKEIECF
ncbi:ApaLI family restriction endonuclease [Clostridium perfringens]|uniref:ApaLI family restriction endonuclease n=1 Tax=Clostridium perfringens TaxID=1502 RepID=UPI0022485C00|nr:ApaLI family restriction endonuclease [Clostridium perfringens]ELC8421776.1 ApaLI family restriction endonuclease [Clostridium perfringens]MCX0379528.1 ApaLI family restriction endonuclease [Clostridium perfringens]MDZ4937078.1 ApaLI family restriction endonuclease [Clostridium perfringens]MDZ4940023.1 ApaLI family restriction endonuclease [Clostridium perfringens]